MQILRFSLHCGWVLFWDVMLCRWLVPNFSTVAAPSFSGPSRTRKDNLLTNTIQHPTRTESSDTGVRSNYSATKPEVLYPALNPVFRCELLILLANFVYCNCSDKLFLVFSKRLLPRVRCSQFSLGVSCSLYQHNTTQHNTKHSIAQYNTAQHSTTQHSTAQHSTAQHSTTQHNTAQHNTTQHKLPIVQRR